MARRMQIAGISLVGIIGIILCGFAASLVGAFSDENSAGAAFAAMTASVGTTTADVEDVEEETITIDQVPPAVRAMVELHTHAGTVNEIERSQHNGMTVYEVDFAGPDGIFELAFDEQGRQLGIEEADDDVDGDDAEDDDDLANETETAISIDELPAAVRNRLAAFTAEDAVADVLFVTDNEDEDQDDDADDDDANNHADDSYYEIEFTTRSGNASVMMSVDGTVLAARNAIGPSKLPQSVVAELMGEFPGAIIGEAESVQVYYYQVELTIDGKSVDVVISANGEMEDDD